MKDMELLVIQDDKKRNEEFLKETVKSIVKAIAYTKRKVNLRYPQLTKKICETPYFITTEELRAMYPDKTGKERERLITEKYKTVFIMKIGDVLSDGEKHDGRAPDYDDWALNGDLLFWNEVLEDSLEISSMGIRVDDVSLISQLEKYNAMDRLQFDYHKMIKDNVLPLTIGGGIGQSRLCMLLLEKAHIGEVQVSVWPEKMSIECDEKGVQLL